MQSSSRRDRARVGGLSGLATQFPRVASANPASVPKRCSIRYIFKPPAWLHVRAEGERRFGEFLVVADSLGIIDHARLDELASGQGDEGTNAP